MRIVLAIIAALVTGFVWWPIALRESAYILFSEMWHPGYIFGFVGVGLSLVVLAGWRERKLIWLWPLLFFAGSEGYLRLTFGGLSPVCVGLEPVSLTFVGCVLGMLWLNHRAKRAAAPPLWDDK